MSIVLIVGLCLFVFGCAHTNKRSHEDMLKYGIKLAKAGYWHEAAYHWRQILNEDPDNVAALNNLAIAAETEGYPRESHNALAKALELRPDSKPIRKNLMALEIRFKEEIVPKKEQNDEK